jgi:hypothetical protein
MTHTNAPRGRRGRARAGAAVALLAGVSGALAVAAPAAGAKTTTLHLFSHTTSFALFDAHGHTLPAHTPPAKAAGFDNTGIDYVGSHKHHGAKVVGSDHLRCLVLKGGMGRCSGQIALGGSMILGSDELVSLRGGPAPVKINGGTGIFRGAHGLITARNAGRNDTDFVIRITK